MKRSNRQTGCRSSRAVSGQRDAVHDAAEAVIIVDRPLPESGHHP
jgi:hypothetical protein